MPNHIFNVPDIGEGTAVAELVCWHVKVGDVVEEDQLLADLMTDKATVEISSPVAGTVLVMHGTVGDELPVGSPFVEFSSGFEAMQPSPPLTGSLEERGSPGEPTPPDDNVAVAAPQPHGRPTASPAVRKRAADLSIDLNAVCGSGPAGRIRHSDLTTYLAYQPKTLNIEARPQSANIGVSSDVGEIREVPLVGLRRKIAQKMEIATRTIPHFSYMEEFDMSALEVVRERLNGHYAEGRTKLTLLPFLVTALCRTLPAYPQINALFDEDAGIIRQYRGVHVGIATQTPTGLVVPVLRNAEQLGLWAIADEIKCLSSGARDGSLSRDQLTGSTITITSLGRLGGVVTTPVINHPEVAIIGPNNIVERPVARDGSIVLRKVMNISSSFDHRVVDGHDAATFVQALKVLIEEPTLLLST